MVFQIAHDIFDSASFGKLVDGCLQIDREFMKIDDIAERGENRVWTSARVFAKQREIIEPSPASSAQVFAHFSLFRPSQAPRRRL
jgi:hypothetical protein